MFMIIIISLIFIELENTSLGIRHADNVAPSVRKS
jgi:hypothetical protein